MKRTREQTWTSGIWAGGHESTRLHFLGRSPSTDVNELAARLMPAPAALSWLDQVHSNRVLEATTGRVGEGDALVTSRDQLALAIATADCVPVLFSTRDQIAAAHAGWRGLVDGVLAATLSRLDATPATVEVWIGPAIGACCYEVGEEVAARLRRAGNDISVTTLTGQRPHADLQAIAVHQLETAGVSRIHVVDLCTRCNPDRLWSYRRDGEAAGRNWALIWRQ